jgi:hypothetical protein
VAVPRPVLLAILGLALCVTALVAVRGFGGSNEQDLVAPAPIPTTPTTAAKPKAEPGARGRARTRPRVQQATPAKPAEQAGQAAAAKPAPKLSKAEVTKLEDVALLASVAKALGQNDVVVLFFSRPGAADDTGARSAVAKLRGINGVQVFTPRFEDLENYKPILAGVGVSQVPSIVIAKPGRKAKLIEGFVDRQTLRQQVEDSLR